MTRGPSLLPWPRLALSSLVWRGLAWPVLGMTAVVLASNILVLHPFELFGLGDDLTWGAFSYPFAFLITDLTNRRFGAAPTRRVIYVGFVLGVALSAWLATPRVAAASGSAFLLAQLLDVVIFERLRNKAWWMPPFVSSLISSALDTIVFFTLAFSCHAAFTALFAAIGIHDACGTDLPWERWALADYGIKLAFAALFLVPYGVFLRHFGSAPETPQKAVS